MCKLVSKALILICMGFVYTGDVSATDYYLSASGNDRQAGTSPARAWRTITQLNGQDLAPGDRVFFQGGATFTGHIYLAPSDSGTATSPIVVTSYGSGRATIDGGDGDGLLAYNTGGVEIHGINFVGSGIYTNAGHGIFFYTDRSDGYKFEHIYVDQVDVSGFREGGIGIGSWHPSQPGYHDVRIANTRIFGNGESGIVSYGYGDPSSSAYAHEGFHIAYNEVFDNFGDPTNFDQPTGNGLVLGHVDRAVIEFNHAYNNGGINSQNSGGPVGIWAWHANAITIQVNIAHDNMTGGYADGGGFDLDGGVTNSVMQYNYSYNNDGAGYGIFQFSGAAPYHNNVVRYNISYNDGRNNNYGGIMLWAAGGETMQDVEIYGNTVFMGPTVGGQPSAFLLASDPAAMRNIHVRNNILVTTGGLPLVKSRQSMPTWAVQFQGNAYWPDGQIFQIIDNNWTHANLSDWRSASGQEMLNGNPVGLSVNPKLVNPSNPELLTKPTDLLKLHAFRLQDDSPLIDAGLNLQTRFSVNPGTHDFYQQALPQGEHLDIGAEEHIVCNDLTDSNGDGLPDCSDNGGNADSMPPAAPTLLEAKIAN